MHSNTLCSSCVATRPLEVFSRQPSSAACTSISYRLTSRSRWSSPIRESFVFKSSIASTSAAKGFICLASTETPSLQLATAKLPQFPCLCRPQPSLSLYALRANMVLLTPPSLLTKLQTIPWPAQNACRQVNIDTFKKRMYDWASSMTSSGRNMPFSLPLRTRQTSDGFEISLLRISNGEPVDVATIAATVEDEPGTGDIFFVRFYEGRGASLVRNGPLPEEPYERLKTVINGLIDVPMIMSTMKTAIRQAVSQSGKG